MFVHSQVTDSEQRTHVGYPLVIVGKSSVFYVCQPVRPPQGDPRVLARYF